ncbi:peptide-methionine (S)-S-oxide reductase MsrA [Tetragenococcus koreensis]|uniref:Peptide methionine sulfoxide reductase MsrA n=1 Tax=Tetragenococcus koreensis TaxID=290335 RepID=A0AAN4UDA4_9ENTE|nr:peptide-methionine (S)-S-oxide reductase MsrA [Tetragenococcus koreensis]MCF1617437.1 peptide-methionine (S)-S-oxide reductase MsrA [Tetragenococcus koreensis]MCF1621786.1 peptide-methionine (S)-S-oxide reductase MsrA [Tetragenococcus koreensis]MCF1678199.1 peptide-methionine (S)-S-oxide reductase MsrA [Tetragenococcus koreensis]MCF1680687.1 peptide-methionine (S)-S-oxide reductase MsrA [Tetragenococcus koreensis]MCF1682518.1 peptide-methionine (S)-S-oxide reductase MsrA [Tetragenococcus ko
MERTREEVLRELYNLIINKGTRDWERSVLTSTKDALEAGVNVNAQLAKLEEKFRPLALRDNLTGDVADFYLKITGESVEEARFDFSKHSIEDFNYQDYAIFGGGCFWCMVEPFETKSGIDSVLSGYTGGHTPHPSYDQVLGGFTGHVEAVEIIFDTRMISYKELVDLYWQLIDPTDGLGQFQDRGYQYRPIIFVRNEQQRQIAEESKQKVIDSGRYKQPIVTEIQPASTFWPAENHYQQFYKKDYKRYKRIKRYRQRFLLYQYLKGEIRMRWKKGKT